MPKPTPSTHHQYHELLQTLKQKVTASQHRAAMSVNSHLIYLYWQIGGHILYEEERQGWGSKVIAQLSNDLTSEFPEMSGFSLRNIKYMRSMADIWSADTIVQQVAAQLGESVKNEFTQQAAAQLGAKR
jgi:predicted nuclease of restriction endonuclease-like (RecB) superfamily